MNAVTDILYLRGPGPGLYVPGEVFVKLLATFLALKFVVPRSEWVNVSNFVNEQPNGDFVSGLANLPHVVQKGRGRVWS